MKKTKKWLAVLLAGSMIMAGGMSVTASAAEVDEVAPGISQASETVYWDGDFAFIKTGNKTAKIVDYDGPRVDIKIPIAVFTSDEALVVTSIGRDAFSNMPTLRSIVVPDTVTSFGQGAFSDNPSLLRITIPSSLHNYTANLLRCPSVKVFGVKGSNAERIAKDRHVQFVDINGTRFYGDVDFDGQITSGDAQAILRASAEQEYFFSDQKKAADVNCDGSILSDDAMNVLRYSAGYTVTGTKIGQVIK